MATFISFSQETHKFNFPLISVWKSEITNPSLCSTQHCECHWMLQGPVVLTP